MLDLAASYDTRAPAGSLDAAATLWVLGSGTLHLHLRASPQPLDVPGPDVPATLPLWTGSALEQLWRRLVIANGATERTAWRARLAAAVGELSKLLVNCKDNRARFRWVGGQWAVDEDAGGVTGSTAYDALAVLESKY